MSTQRDLEMVIKAFLADGVTDLPDSSFDAVRATINETRQWVVIGPWRVDKMFRYARSAVAAAAVVLVVVVGIRFLSTDGGVGVQPTATPTTAPTGSSTPLPTPEGTPIADPSGRLQPGTYVAHPFDTLLDVDTMGFTFTTPSSNWEAAGAPGRTIGVAWNTGDGDSVGVGIGFLKVHSLNGDACNWSSTDDDIQIGPTEDDPTLDDLVTALEGLTAVANVEGPYAESISNVTGQGFELTMPATLQDPAVDCDEQEYRIWNASGFDIYAQGPSNTWRLGTFDVNEEVYIVMASFMPDTPDEVRDELMSIFRSVRIEASGRCAKYDHNCN